MFVFSSCPQEELQPEDITEVVTFSTSIKLSVGLSLLCHQCSFPFLSLLFPFPFSTHISTPCSFFLLYFFPFLTNVLQKCLSLLDMELICP